ncbi:hypothetical protein [Streptomyces sp. WG5]|uniref:hypothetical protein n=1 Tax=Streptomyces sp. WG5 TaxID=3417648 RepID=UPI003CEC1BDE
MTKIVKNLSVMRTEESDRHLKILMQAGMGQSEATRWALRFAAGALAYAWMNGYEDRGTVPQMLVQYKVKEESS